MYNKNMSKVVDEKNKKTIIESVESKYGVDLGYATDSELHKSLKREGVPSLSKLLKLIHST
jgi:cobalamin biosynthesis protein CbiG